MEHLGFVVAGAVLALLVEPLLYYRLLGSRGIGEARLWGRLLMLASLAAVSAYSVGVGSLDLDGIIAAAPLLLLVQMAIARLYDRRTVAIGVLETPRGERVVFHVIDSGRASAFTLAAGGRVYASSALVRLLSPEEVAAVIAHENGHARSLSPVPAWVAVLALIGGLSGALQGVVDSILSGDVIGALLGFAVAASAWIGFNWAWEHLADTYSLEDAGLAAVTALARITGASPTKPSPRLLVAEAASSLRPRLSSGLLVNPHPPPQVRLWLLLRLMKGPGRGGVGGAELQGAGA